MIHGVFVRLKKDVIAKGSLNCGHLATAARWICKRDPSASRVPVMR